VTVLNFVLDIHRDEEPYRTLNTIIISLINTRL